MQTSDIADKAAQIRARYTSFKAMDALQLAAAVLSGCDCFLTNDKQLQQFDEIEVQLVSDLTN
ncbi:MAG: PIN domain-containing protein [Saccharofermentans sp.]|nr:PIN domain-containing protein [Saccharofermentans sp.]